jgi:UDP-GlcNAc:undecaprenyl-phosphate GlcNAc-1-phosphate transferase
MFYALIFASTFLLALCLTPLAIKLGTRLGVADAPGGRRQHLGVITRIGGLPVFVSFISIASALFIFTPHETFREQLPFIGLLAGTVFAFVFGLLDDWKEFSAAPQFIAQFILVIIALGSTIFIEEVTLPFFGFQRFPWYITFPLTAFWIIGMMNTINFLDGLDGLATGVDAIASLLFAVHMLNLGRDDNAVYALAFAGACLGFLIFNFNPAKIFLGSAGAMVVGYVLACLSILAPARVATALLIMAIPIADTAWQIFNRWRHGQSPFKGDRGHLHFRLIDLGWSQRRIVLSYWATSAVVGVTTMLIESPVAKFLGFAALVIVVGWVLMMLAKRGERNDK